jgi:hypothetical protein
METERKELDGRELHGREFDGNVCDDGRELYIDFVGTLPLYTRQLALRFNEASFIKIISSYIDDETQDLCPMN